MTSSVLHYVYDPLCGWCYAATPLVDAAKAAGIEIRLHGGGLWPTPTWLSRDQRHHILANDRYIATLTKQTFGAAYLERMSGDAPFLLSSLPVIAAIEAAGSARAGADLTMLHAIQTAHYVEGLRVTEPEVLGIVASSQGLAEADFFAALKAADIHRHIDDSLTWMRKFRLHGFPGFILEREGAFTPVRHEQFYGKPEAFVADIGLAA